MKIKSAFSFLASLALAAAVVFASGACPAAILVKPKVSTSNASKVTVTWSAYKGAKSYAVFRATRANIKYAKIVKKSTKSRKFVDKKAKMGYKYFYWVVPTVKNSTKGLFSSSQSKKCGIGGRRFILSYVSGLWNGATSIRARVGTKVKFGLLVNNKYPLSKYGLKLTVKKSGVHTWQKKTDKKGLLGYFTSKKKGVGYFKEFKVGNIEYDAGSGKITWY